MESPKIKFAILKETNNDWGSGDVLGDTHTLESCREKTLSPHYSFLRKLPLVFETEADAYKFASKASWNYPNGFFQIKKIDFKSDAIIFHDDYVTE